MKLLSMLHVTLISEVRTAKNQPYRCRRVYYTMPQPLKHVVNFHSQRNIPCYTKAAIVVFAHSQKIVQSDPGLNLLREIPVNSDLKLDQQRNHRRSIASKPVRCSMSVRLFAGIIAFSARVRAYRHTARRVFKQSRLRRWAGFITNLSFMQLVRVWK